MLKTINLKNRTALVTGAGKGLGKACAIALAEAGAKVFIISRTLSDLNKVSKIIKKTKKRKSKIKTIWQSGNSPRRIYWCFKNKQRDVKMLKKCIKEQLKQILIKYTKIEAPTYAYNLDPLQLAEIVNSLEQVKKIEGNICEIGVARGMTTRFICEYLKEIKNKKKFYCIDTFQSFEKEDIKHEIEHRNKKRSELIGFRSEERREGKENKNR